MTIREIACWPVRYTADPFQQEPRNIGLIAHDQGETYCLMMGDDGHIADPRYFCHALKFPESAGWIYAEWVQWFRGLAKDAKTPDAIQNELDQLTKTGARFAGGDYFGAIVPAAENVTSVARRLFADLVKVPTLPTPSKFDTDFANVINSSEIEFTTTLHRDVELEILSSDRPAFVRLPIFIETPVPVGIKLLRFEGTTDAMVSSQSRDIIFSFDALTSHRILDRKHCIVLHDRPTGRRHRHLERIAAHVHLLKLDDPDTPRVLKSLAQPI